MKKWILLFLLFSTLTSWGQYNYTYTDPCTLLRKSVYVPTGGGVTVNYFGNTSTFQSLDFQNGVFDTWIDQVAQINSSSPCQEITTTLVNNINNITISNTLTVVTNVISVTSVAQTLSSVTGGSFSSTAEGVSNTESGNSNQNNKNENQTNTNSGTNSGTTGTGSTGNQNQGSQTNPSTSGGTPTQPSTGTPQQGGDTTGTDQPASTGSPTSESSVEGKSGSGGSLANSVSNAVDGGSADGGSSSGGSGSKKSNAATKNAGSLIASGDIVAIANTDQTQNFRIVGSITHANTRGTRIKGVLFNYTSGVDNLNITFYKSWINKSRKLNTVGAQSFMMDFDKNFFSTTTVLESYKVNKKLTGMFGINFTAGKMGERSLLNMSAVGGAHTTFRVNDRISTSLLVLGVYSPFTQFYEGKWWDAGILAVPFNSWDIKITKTFKFNVSFTGVYQVGESFLNYQVLTGGKLNF
jgi:hypothetical protein